MQATTMQTTTLEENKPYYVLDSPYEIERWRPLVNWLLAIPHMMVLSAMSSLVFAVAVFQWLALLFTGRINRGMYGFLAMHERYNSRSEAFHLGFSSTYAPFDFSTGGSDNGAYPALSLNLPEPADMTSRKALFNVLLAIPHYLLFMILAIAVMFVLVFGWFAVLFAGRWPQGMRDFLVQFNNYKYRIWVYVFMVETRYPKFKLV